MTDPLPPSDEWNLAVVAGVMTALGVAALWAAGEAGWVATVRELSADGQRLSRELHQLKRRPRSEEE